MRKPTFSACLITRNEEKLLPSCLESIRDAADQIVVVDTGSTDRTVEIAKSSGARVEHFTWCNDFAAARNESLKYATGDWVFVIDADEELAQDSQAELKKVIQNRRASGAMCVHVNDNPQIYFCSGREMPILRLFRRHPSLKFRDRILEGPRAESFLALRGRYPELIVTTGIRLIHHGYTPETIRAKDKVNHYRRLWELRVQEEPQNPLPRFHLLWMEIDALLKAGEVQNVKPLAQAALALLERFPTNDRNKFEPYFSSLL